MSAETKSTLSTYNPNPNMSEQTSPTISQSPFIGQRFATHEAAYECYSQFAKRAGFSIRRHRSDGKDGVGRGLMRRYFVCHRAGNTPSKQPSPKPQRNRKSSRCNCQAFMRITRTCESSILEWQVTGFSNHHNHELLLPDQVRFLPAYRVISEPDKTRILMFAKSGISVQQMMKLLELENCVGPGELGYIEKDVRNLIQCWKKLDDMEEREREGDDDLVRMCERVKERDPNFRFDCTVDCRDNKLENIAWSYNSSVQLYEAFGDAVVFDTSKKLEGFSEMIFGIWVGMNNYGLPCFFGCVLLKEESLRSFTWALQVLQNFMNGKPPQTILTDQNPCLREAIQTQMPTSKHAFFIWSIMTKLPSWFNSILGDRYLNFKTDFLKLYNSDTIEEFEIGWHQMVENYGFRTNRHVLNLFAIRSFWALPYLRNHFLAGFYEPGASKLINAFINRFLTSQTRFSNFIEQVSKFSDQTCSHQTTQQSLQTTLLKTGSPIESHANLHLTPYAFSKLQDELVNASHYAAFQTDESSFLVRHHTKGRTDRGHIVTWVPCHELVSCSCRLFEFTGILCRHALRVLSTVNCFQIPEHYLPVRWRRAHASMGPVEEEVGCSDKVKMLEKMVSELVSEAVKSEERVEFVSQEIEGILSRIRGQD